VLYLPVTVAQGNQLLT